MRKKTEESGNDNIAFCLNSWKDRVAIKLVNDVDKVGLGMISVRSSILDMLFKKYLRKK